MVKRSATDKHFSDCVRERAGWRCERCGTYYPEGDRQGLHCSHLYSRSKKSVRWHPQNAAAHCYGCHQYLGGRPQIFENWRREYLGQAIAGQMERIAHKTKKLNTDQEKDIRAFLRSEIKRMQKLRNDGETGRIEFGCPPHLEKVE